MSGTRDSDIPPELQPHTAEAAEHTAAEIAHALNQADSDNSWEALIRAAPAIALLDRAAEQGVYDRARRVLPSGGLQSLKAAVKHERATARAAARAAIQSDDGRPRIVLTNTELDVNVQLGIKALRAHNADSPAVFLRAGELVDMKYPDGVPRIEVLTWPEIKQLLSRAAAIVRTTPNGDEHYADAPDALAGALAKHVGTLDPAPLPLLTGIIEAPSMRPDGSIIDSAGYDAATGYYYHPALGLTVEYVEISEARTYLLDLLADFPWEDPASRANALALLLTPIVRPAIPGLVPLALLDSPIPGAGKGQLLSLAAIAATGREAALRLLSETNDDAKKEVFSAALGGRPLIAFDEVGRLTAPALAHALTAATIEGRLLGVSRDASAANRAVWAAMGSNVPLTTAMARRVYLIRLIPKTARPWERTDFRHRDLLGHATGTRGRFLGSLIALCRNWHDAGRPGASPATPAMGQFHHWTQLVGGILEAADLGPILANQTNAYASTDDAEWANLLQAIHATLESGTFTVRDLLSFLAHPDGAIASPIGEAMPLDYHPSDTSTPARLGIALRRRTGARLVHGNEIYQLVAVGTGNGGGKSYRVVTVKNAGEHG